LRAAGKGFGNTPEPTPPKRSTKEVTSGDNNSQVAEKETTAPAAAPPELNAGQKALQTMRRERAEAKDEELRKVRELLQTDEQVQETPAAIPEKVANRMLGRMLPFVGIPLLLSLSGFVAFWYLATYKDMEFQPGLVAGTTIALLAVGLLVSAPPNKKI